MRMLLFLLLALGSTSALARDPTSDLVEALNAERFNATAVRQAVEAGADLNVRMCRPPVQGGQGWAKAPVLSGKACTRGFVYGPLWAVSGLSWRGPPLKERVEWIAYFRKHGANTQWVFDNTPEADGTTALPFESIVVPSFEPDGEIAQGEAAVLSTLINDGWEQGIPAIVQCIGQMARAPIPRSELLPVFRRVGQQTGHLAQIDAALAAFSKAKGSPVVTAMAPAPGATIAARQPEQSSPPAPRASAPLPPQLPQPTGVPASADVGTRVCRSVPAESREYAGYLVMGQPAYKTRSGVALITAFLENRNKERIQIRVSGIAMRGNDGSSSPMTSFDYEGSQLSANSIIWEPAKRWSVCE